MSTPSHEQAPPAGAQSAAADEDKLVIAAERDALTGELEAEIARSRSALSRITRLEDQLLDGAAQLARLKAEATAAVEREQAAKRRIAELEHEGLEASSLAADAGMLALELEELRDAVTLTASSAPGDGSAPGAGSDPQGRPEWVPRVPVPDGPIARPGVKVACILDPFSVMAFRYECELVTFGQADWKDVLERTPPAFLFVESAWRGNEGRWNYTLAKREGPKPPVRDLVAWCNERGIPTVFWNKEDPNNFELFVGAALLFDHIFTVDENCIPRYRDEHGHSSVHVLPFAAQPRIHNPVKVPGHRSRNVVFAGSWYGEKHPNRLKQAEVILKPAVDYDVEIFSRFQADEKYQFPPELRNRVVGSLSYDDMLAANKLYKVALNINSVVGSPTMCARRIFELLAAGTSVLSGTAPAIENLLGQGLVWQCDSAEQTRKLLNMLLRNPEIRDRTAVLGLREILSRHTYGDRFDAVARVVGLDAERRKPSLSIVCPTMRSHQIESVLANVARQTYRPLQLVLVLHGLDEDAEAVRARAAELGIDDVRVVHGDRDKNLGAIMNQGCEAADGDYLSKMDDDNFYGAHYAADLMNAFRYTSAGIVGKWAVYTYLGSSGTLILRFPEHEHRYVRLVQGGTITMPREVWSEHRFPDLPRAVDTHLLRAAERGGVRAYACDRFNYVSVRASDTSSHTWKISDDALLVNGVAQVFGATFEHVVV